MSGDGCMAAAEIGRLRRMLQEPLARRGFHLGVEHGNLADHHIGMRQLAREQCVARGFVWQRKVPHLQPSAPLAQGMGDLRKHRSGPRPRAQLLQAAFVDVYERYAFGRSHWRLNTRQTVLQVLVDCLQHPGLCQRAGHQTRDKQPGYKENDPPRPPLPFRQGHLAFQRVMPWYCPALLSILNK